MSYSRQTPNVVVLVKQKSFESFGFIPNFSLECSKFRSRHGGFDGDYYTTISLSG
jgi:hypothetical protein